MTYERKLNFVRNELDKRRGQFRKICRQHGISINTLNNVLYARNKEHMPSTIDKLYMAVKSPQ